MLIPSIDLMGGKIVQLVQGEKKALEFDNFDYWIERFSKYPLVQMIDLDAARGTGNNRPLVNRIRAAAELPGWRRDSQPRNSAQETSGSRCAQDHSWFLVVERRQYQHGVCRYPC